MLGMVTPQVVCFILSDYYIILYYSILDLHDGFCIIFELAVADA